MVVVSRSIAIQTKGEGDILDLTRTVASILAETRLSSGIVTVFVPGATGALTTIEYEPGLLKDFPDMLERIAPRGLSYEHERRWHDGNGHSHVRASLIGPSITIPFVDGKLSLGTWQQIVFLELDVRSRSRNLMLQIIGE